MKAGFFFDILDEYFPAEEAQRQFKTSTFERSQNLDALTFSPKRVEVAKASSRSGIRANASNEF